MHRLLAPFRDPQTYRTILFLATAIPVGVTSLTVLFTGWVLAVSLAITPLVVPVLMGLAAAVGLLARLESYLARELLGIRTYPAAATKGQGFWRRALGVLVQASFWRQQGYLLLRFVSSFTFVAVELGLLYVGLWAIGLPIYYRWDTFNIGSFHGDTLPKALLGVPVGIVVLVTAMHLAGPLGKLSIRMATLLGTDPDQVDRRTREEIHASRLRWLAVDAGVFAGVNLLLIIIWALTGAGYFWPEWTLISLGLVLAIHAGVVAVEERPELTRGYATPALAIHRVVTVSLVVFLVLVWAITGHGYFWPVWAILGLGSLLLIHEGIAFARRSGREELTERIAELETTRAGAVETQEAERRRIERDLHDGAQARLVALGMSIGMAEQKLETDPEGAAELLADARLGAREALEELRDLARGIHPPVLTDRGLEAAIVALTDHNPLRVDASVDLDERPPEAVESAAYFVVAESLANATKYSGATRFDLRIRRYGDTLVVEAVDDGKGGADPSGNGLTGLRHRVEALDGRFQVTSPAGGPTTVRAELPCGS